MYQPIEFRDNDPVRAYEHITRNPFGILVANNVTAVGARMSVTHLPFLLDDEDSPTGLVTHYAIRNKGLGALRDGDEVLAIFPGPHAHVSPTWYKVEQSAPTWNYTAVHLTGIFRRTDPDRLHEILDRTVRRFEGDSPQSWPLSTIPEEKQRSMMRAIVGFHIETVSIEGGYKLSQNKLGEDVQAIEHTLRHLGRPGDVEVADEMVRAGLGGRTKPSSTDPNTWMGPLKELVTTGR